ncbi:MAG TPA: hypothetical protein VL484_06735 [Vicinamibacterales bacterium]|jgi:hypothetical protein|nr:hypothetical protein [Vicinamibacterales bacterium]
MGRGKRDAVIGPNHLRQAKFFEGALKDREGELLRVVSSLASEQVPTHEVGDREGIAVLAIAEKEFAFVVRTPAPIRLVLFQSVGSGQLWQALLFQRPVFGRRASDWDDAVSIVTFFAALEQHVDAVQR